MDASMRSEAGKVESGLWGWVGGGVEEGKGSSEVQQAPGIAARGVACVASHISGGSAGDKTGWT
jgi:hypothetical protein